MTHYLVYWKTYWQDMQQDNSESIPVWHTDNRKFRDQIRKNDRLWVVVTGGDAAPNEWRLLQVFFVSRANPKPVKSRWGKYEIIGSRKNNRVFRLQNQPDLTAILWMMEFSTGKRIRTLGQKIGQSLQTHGHRTLTEGDVVLLENYADCLRKA